MEKNSSSSGISPPNAAVTQNLANVNSTSLHFLNATRPTWMTGTIQYPTASTPLTPRRLPQDNDGPPRMPLPTPSTTTTHLTTAITQNNDGPPGIPLPTPSTTTIPLTTAITQNNDTHAKIPPPTAGTTTAPPTTALRQDNHADPEIPPPTISTITALLVPPPSPLITHATSSLNSLGWGPVQQHQPLHFSSNQSSPIATQPPSIVGPTPFTTSVTVPLKRAAEVRNDDASKRLRLATDPAHPLPCPSLTPQPANMASYNERLQAAIEAARQQSPYKTLNTIEIQRVALLSQASKEHDLFFLLLHQLHCLAFLHPPSITRLGFGQAEKAGLVTLDPILGQNSFISRPVLTCFANFPCRADNLENAAYVQSVDQVKNYLVSLGFKWDGLRQTCLRRRFPPCWEELLYYFSVSSMPALATLYVSLDRHISPHRHANWESQSLHLFCRSRDQYESLRRQPGFRLSQFLNNAIHDFGLEYQNMLATFGSIQLPPAPAPPPGQSHPTAPGPVPPHHAYTGVATNAAVPARPAIAAPMQHAQLLQPVAPGAPSSRSTSRRSGQPSSSSLTFGPTAVLSTANQAMQPIIWPVPRQALSSSPVPPPSQNNSALGLNGHLPLTYDHLLPPPGFQMAQASHANPDIIAIHQLQLRSPSFAVAADGRGEATATRLYAYMDDFALSPQRVSQPDHFFLWNFDLSAELLAHRPGRLPASRVSQAPGAREYGPGCILLRLNCIKQDAGAPTPGPGAYAETATSWPAFVFVSLNETEDVELRRKTHWGRDRATDITDLVSPGRNTLSLSYHPQSAEESDAFFLAVQVFRVADQDSVRALVKTMDEATAVAAMAAPLNESGQDDEISCADVGLSIDLIDPFMAKIWTTPVRGRRCKHRECFDLDAFLISRASSEEKNYYRLKEPDRWNCPICGRDARPQELVIDGFLVKVRATLEADGNLEARAIRAFLDGSWIPRIG
ncbi:hypothetical protein DV736_g6506, partial [Chaetothyriales sp. CBS 134916]